MDSDLTPTDFIRFTFDAGRVESVLISDGWSEAIPVEHFGGTALIAYHEQQAQASMAGQVGIVGGQLDLPRSVRDDLGERLMKANQMAFAFLHEAMARLEAGPVEPSEPETFTDPHRYVTVTAQDGQITAIEVNPQRLKADPVAIEEALVAAINSVEAPTNPLSGLRAEHQEITRILNDYRRPVR